MKTTTILLVAGVGILAWYLLNSGILDKLKSSPNYSSPNVTGPNIYGSN